MKAITQRAYGDVEVLGVEELERPRIGETDVLVRVRAAAVGQGVWHLMAGRPYLVRILGFGFRRPKQVVLGADVAGMVEAVGSAVTRFEVGDEVFGSAEGTFAEWVAAPEKQLAHKPASLDFHEASALVDSAVTALQAVRDEAHVVSGDRVLVIGASGGVGSYAVQIARTLGASVTGVASTPKLDFVRSLGADDVIDHRREEIDARDVAYDVVVDIAGNRSLSLLRRAMSPTGRLVIVGGENGGDWSGGMGRSLRAAFLDPFVKQSLKVLISMKREAEDLEQLARWAEEGRVRPRVDRVFAMEDAASAIRAMREGAVRGKVVLAWDGAAEVGTPNDVRFADLTSA